ncbi:hypothetical protein SDC9_105174 [bioreactor metagenome]|uniref:Uncharacterized protein n=1 Tax=bioreactor metagenome TaxID=1076179 RepID=A0A645B5C2_9ZZZZ
MEDHGGDRNVVAHCGHDFHHRHAPCAVTGIRDRRAIHGRALGADDGGQRIAAVAERHGREERTRLVKAQITVGHRVDVADVGGDHHARRHGLFQLAQHLARVQVFAACGWLFLLGLFDHVEAVGVTLVGPLVEFLLPCVLLGLDGVGTLCLGGIAVELHIGKALDQLGRHGLGVAVDAHGDFLDQAQVGVIGFHLNDLGRLGPVVHAVLRQRAERAHA